MSPLLTLVRPPIRSNGRSFVLPVMYLSFFSPRVLRAPSTGRPETLPHGRNLAVFYNPTPKIWGALPKKIWGQKHAKFRSILDHFRLWSQISPERLKISKIGKLTFPDRFLLRSMKKIRSTNYRDLDVSLDPLKCTFLAYYISTLRGYCALKFLHALEIEQALLAHTPSWAGVPQKNFNHEN